MTAALQAHLHRLVGSNLIEASAGTGKTWTIATLYARLVINDEGPGRQPLPPERILVLTFTRAATRELSDRIRRRLIQCQHILDGREAPPAGDEFAIDLLSRYASGNAREAAVRRIQVAVGTLDAAAISTIDAWVQRVLREHGSGAADLEIREVVESDAALRRQAVRDYWRSEVYPLGPQDARYLLEAIGSPDALESWLGPALNSKRQWPPPPGVPLAAALSASRLDRDAAALAAKNRWRCHHDALTDWFAHRIAGPGKMVDGRRLRPELAAELMARLRQWLDDPTLVRPQGGFDEWGQPTGWALKLVPEGLRAALLKAHQQEPIPDWSPAWEAIAAECAAWPSPLGVLASHALGWVAQRLNRLKHQRGLWSFDDLLALLEERLDRDESLAAQLRTAYPVALIDEFQDTSERQLRVFNRIYELASDDPATGIHLIGDPKQSIYRFRGADIHSYLSARRLTSGRHSSLDTNRRSVKPLVQAVNHFFMRAESALLGADPLPEAGAFGHGAEIPFRPVQPDGPLERLGPAGDNAERLPALMVWSCPDVWGAPDARERSAAHAARRIAELLASQAVGFQLDGVSRALRASDIAVLVRTGTEAAVMRRALQRWGVPSAYLSERDLVLHSQEARDTLDILEAIVHPQDLSRARRAWATRLMGIDWEDQVRQAQDDRLWDQRLARLERSRQLWIRCGVMAALREFLQQEGAVAHCLSLDPAPSSSAGRPASGGVPPGGTGGERRLTNALHLGEWLQELSIRVRSPQALVESLREAISSEETPWRWPRGIQSQLLRLESEADLIRIVTLHKSKGLQYPIVFMPFASAYPDARHSRQGPSLLLRGEQWQPAAGPPADEAELEERREQVRLLYVGMTRAVHQLWLGLVPIGSKTGAECQWHRSAAGMLLSKGAKRSGLEAFQDVQAWMAELAAVGISAELESLQSLDASPRSWVQPIGSNLKPECTVDPGSALRPALRLRTPIDRSWRVSSYSALVRNAQDPDRWDEGRAVEASSGPGHCTSVDSDPEPVPPLSLEPWHGWESNAAFGELLHALLEDAAMFRFDFRENETTRAKMLRRLSASPWNAQADDILQWLERVVSTPLMPWGIPLRHFSSVKAELEFWMPVERLNTEALDTICRQHLWPGRARPALKAQDLRGLLMGFADLVMEHQGRYGVLDYKSNRLGPSSLAYEPASLEAAILEHRYDVQASVYLLALHRLLRLRLGPAYRAEAHLGPVQFLFLRGIDHAHSGLMSLAPTAGWINSLEGLMQARETLN